MEELLAQIAWPEAVDGCAICVERVIVDREDESVIGPEEALADPNKRDVRLAVGLMRDGASWCTLRVKDVPDLIESSDAVPELIDVLRQTLR